jgi:protein TonB
MTRRSIVALFSVCIHAVILVFAMTADLWRPISEWPTPRSALAFIDDTPRPVVVDDNVPRPSRRPADAATPHEIASSARPIELAPVQAPPAIGQGPECVACGLGDAPGPIVAESNSPGTFSVGEPTLPAAPTAPPTPVRLHSGIKPPQRVAYVTPLYPALAKSAHVEGIVIIEATLDERGNVVRTQVLRSIQLLDAAAVDAVRQWKFTPTLLNGVAVPIVMTVTVNFRLD